MPTARSLLLGLLAAAIVLPAVLPRPAAALPDSPSVKLRAFVAWQTGYLLHLLGSYEQAVDKFRESVALHPTAEGHTFLGWSLSELGRLDEAIAECKTAIEIDPDYGNPYNDIGVYLIDLGRADEAVPWLEKAIKAERYCCYQFPHFNLGRIRMLQGEPERARESFRRALEHDPRYVPALRALEVLERSGIRGL